MVGPVAPTREDLVTHTPMFTTTDPADGRVHFRRWVLPAALALIGVTSLGLSELIGTLGARRASAGAATTPTQLVDTYLRERFVDRDAHAAARLQCRTPDLSAIDTKVRDLVARESAFSIRITTTWSDLVPHGGPPPSVDLDLAFTTSTSSHAEPWTFQLVQEDGWKVCGATHRGAQ